MPSHLSKLGPPETKGYGGLGFTSPTAPSAEVAQTVERGTENPCVPGSSPGLGILGVGQRISGEHEGGSPLFPP